MRLIDTPKLSVAVLCAMAIVLMAWPATAAETITGEHCKVKYYGVDEAYAESFATIYDTAYEGFRALLGVKLPPTVMVHIETGAYTTQLYPDGKKNIHLKLGGVEDLNPNRGYFHIYGICQQMGLIALYSGLKSLDGLPDGVGVGWGHYCGSLVVDHVWAEQGSSVWPGGWDYSRDGMVRLNSQCKTNDGDAMLNAACTFNAIGEKYGHRKVGSAMTGALAVEPAGHELMGRFCKILDARAEAGASAMVPDSVRKSPIVPTSEVVMLPSKGFISEAWEQTGGWVGYDDDSEDGMRSIAGGGHCIQFNIKGGGELKAVSLKGARYGYPQSDSNFTMSIYDGGFELIQTYSFPYMKFAERGEPLYWVEFNLSGVEVPEDFYVLFNFNPGQTDGVYVGYDANSAGHSSQGASVFNLRNFDDGDWMVRVKVE